MARKRVYQIIIVCAVFIGSMMAFMTIGPTISDPLAACPTAHMCGPMCTNWWYCNPAPVFSCYNPGPCGCGSCPPPPPPGSSGCGSGWGGCGSNGCAPGQVSACEGGNWVCYTDPSTCSGAGGGSGGGGCTNRIPAQPIINYPAPGTVATTNPVTISPYVYDWGHDCTFNDYGFRYYITPNCDPQNPPSAGGSAYVQYNNPNISWAPGDTVCVWTIAINYSQWSPAAFTYFVAPSIPSFSGAGFTDATKCGGTPASGSAQFADTNNPVTYSVNLTSPANDFANGTSYLKEGRVIITPYALASGSVMDSTYMESIAREYAAFRVTGLDTGNYQYSAIDSASAPYWGNSASSGNLTNAAGKATLIGLNTVSGVSEVDNETVNLTFNIRFEDTFQSNYYYVYFMGLAQDPANNAIYSTSPTPGTNYYTATNAWYVDVIPPTVDLIGPHYANPATPQYYYYYYGWSDDYVGVYDVQGYCQSTIEEADSFYHLTYGFWTVPPKDPMPDYPTPTNCNINSYLPGWNYYYTTAPNSNHLNVSLTARDGFCNLGTATINALDPDPWLLTTGGNASASGGFTGFTPRESSLTGLVPGLGDDSYLAKYLSLSGNTTHLASRRSKLSMVALNYEDDSLKPGSAFVSDQWFPSLLSVAASNSTVGELSINSIPANFSVQLGAVSGDVSSVQITPAGGELAIGTAGAGGGVCNGNYAIFVNGNLRIHPSLTTANGSKCLFVVSGDITIDSGAYASAAAAPNAGYDTLEGFFITDGQFITNNDLPVGQTISDGLMVIGGLNAGTVDLGRILQDTQSSNQPAEVFKYDPSYLLRFRNLLGIEEFSIREF